MNLNNKLILAAIITLSWHCVFWHCVFWNPVSLLASPSKTVTEVEKQIVVETLTQTVLEDYIDSKKAEGIAGTLRQKLKAGDYASLEDPHAFAAQLTTDLLEATEDLHFYVGLDPEWIVDQQQKDDPVVAQNSREKELALARQRNFGFREVRILDGNVGYLNFTYFDDPELAHQTVTAIMQFLSHTDAVIIDLRFNNGGVLEMAQLLCSYFLSSVPSQMLFDFYDIQDGERIERGQWVLPSVSGKRMPDTPLYLLTSSTSFSSAEWFAFILKNLGRATVIGEQTAGGAHPVNRRALNDRFILQVPTGEIKDAVLRTDFESVGVVPDLKVSSEAALHTAHHEALSTLMQAKPDQQERYAWFLPLIQARLSQPEVPNTLLPNTLLKTLTGHYGSRQIMLEDGKLYYSWNGEDRVRVYPISESVLALEGVDDFRLRIRSQDGVVTGLERVYMEGRSQLLSKTR